MNASIYARKSTEQDVADDQKSVDRQVESARRFIQTKGWVLDEHHVYIDDGVSGALFDRRPEYQRMLAAASTGAFEALVVFDLDRLGRDGHKTMVALHTLAELGVFLWDSSSGQPIQIDSSEQRFLTNFRAESAQQFRETIRKNTKAALHRKAQQGFVAGGQTYGYTNVRVDGHVERRINEAEAAVVRVIYERFASGAGPQSIAVHLNQIGAPSPHAQRGRVSGWSVGTVKAILKRPLYHGQIVYGVKRRAYNRELGRASGKEKGLIAVDESAWIRTDAPHLRIIDPDLAARVEAIRRDRHERFTTPVENGRAPEKAHGRYLLSGGLLICPVCGGHFEAQKWRGAGRAYICATRRRKPGKCSNMLSLPLEQMDHDVLDLVSGVVLDDSTVRELIAAVDDGREHQTAHLEADRDRLTREIEALVNSIASGVPAATIAPAIREREKALASVDRQLAAPRPAAVNVEALRATLEQRTSDWKADLRREPKVARLVLRRLVGPLKLWTGPEARWEAQPTPERLLDGLIHLDHPRSCLTKMDPISAPLRTHMG